MQKYLILKFKGEKWNHKLLRLDVLFEDPSIILHFISIDIISRIIKYAMY